MKCKRKTRRRKFLKPGKIPISILEKLLRKYAATNERVIIGPSIGEDAAVIDFKDKYLVAKTDPITFVSEDCPWYAVNINANDIATMGAVPRWFLATILFPEKKTDRKTVEKTFKQLSKALAEIGVSLCGGHTEITSGLERALIVGQMLGEVRKDKLILSSGARPGDDILVTKGIAIEGVSIIAREKESYLKKKRYAPGYIRRLKNFVKEPGISILKESHLASGLPGIHAMHDPTEGGLSAGLYELSKASNVGLEVDEKKIPVFPECLRLCSDFRLDPLGLIASGCLIIATDKRITEKLIKLLQKNRIDSSVIGKVTEKKGVFLLRKGRKVKLPFFERDEITKIS